MHRSVVVTLPNPRYMDPSYNIKMINLLQMETDDHTFLSILKLKGMEKTYSIGPKLVGRSHARAPNLSGKPCVKGEVGPWFYRTAKAMS